MAIHSVHDPYTAAVIQGKGAYTPGPGLRQHHCEVTGDPGHGRTGHDRRCSTQALPVRLIGGFPNAGGEHHKVKTSTTHGGTVNRPHRACI